jgi:mannose-6-phosphate isomerase-like protein (cupin superfamily)
MAARDKGATMGDYTAKKMDEMEAGFGGGFVKVRAELGVSAFGMQVIQMPPDYGDYPEHDHADSGQEEVYVALAGSGWIDVEGERVELDTDTFVRVAAHVKRKVHAGPQGLRVLVIGGTPGHVYKAPEMTELSGSVA